MAKKPERADIATRFSSERQPVSNGRPKGLRDKLSTEFLMALTADFEKKGATAIKDAREQDPLGYVRVVASLQPTEIEIIKPEDGLSDEQMETAIETLRAMLAVKHDEPKLKPTVN